MKPQKVATGFTNYAQRALSDKSLLILQQLTGNPNFPTPVPALSDVGDAVGAYAVTLAAPTSKANTIAKKAARKILTGMLNQLALYVQLTAGDDLGMIESSGFSLTKLPQPIGVLPKPDKFDVLPFQAGAVKAIVKKIAGADSYRFEYTDAPVTAESTWTSVISTKTNILISNLQSGKQYAFRVTGIGSNPVNMYSNVVIMFVL